MVRVHVSRLKEGMITGYPLMREDGVILLKEGVALRSSHIKRLRELGYEYISRITGSKILIWMR